MEFVLHLVISFYIFYLLSQLKDDFHRRSYKITFRDKRNEMRCERMSEVRQESLTNDRTNQFHILS